MLLSKKLSCSWLLSIIFKSTFGDKTFFILSPSISTEPKYFPLQVIKYWALFKTTPNFFKSSKSKEDILLELRIFFAPRIPIPGILIRVS